MICIMTVTINYNYDNDKNQDTKSVLKGLLGFKSRGNTRYSKKPEVRAQVRSGLTFWTLGYLGAGPRRVLK